MILLKNKIRELSKELSSEIISIRRHLHANPELSMQELNTSAFIAKKLDEYGISFSTEFAKTGFIGIIKAKNPDKKVIALRADMDALQITEENDVDYKSRNEGVMHACGHDAHVASLLGTAIILNKLKGRFEGTIKLIFQPSEEIYPGGAIQMIKDGALNDPVPEHFFGQHVYPELEAGKVGMKSGKYMASTDEIFLTVKGEGGHSANPMNNIDPVVIAAFIIVALQQIVSRFASPEMPTVLSFGRIIGEGRTNIIPNEVKIDGTIRTFDEKWRKEAHKKITKIAQSVAEGMGGNCEVFIDPGYPFLFNNPEITEKTRKWAKDFLGENNVVDLPLRMTAEDFSYFAREKPSCFYRLGTRNEKKGITSDLHSPTFDIDEKSLETGMGLMAWIAVNALI